MLLLAVLEARSGEERKLETRSSYSSGIAAALEEEEVAEGCFDCGISRLTLSPLEVGADRAEMFVLLICTWLRTEEVLAGCTGGTDGVFEGTGRFRRSAGVAGSFFIFT